MKQTEMFRKTKPRFCSWLLMRPAIRECGEPGVVMIHNAAYCAKHAEQAQKYFGQATLIPT